MHIVVIAKPPSDGSGLDSLEAALVEVRAAGHEVRTCVTRAPGDARRFARAAAGVRADLVIVVGGDGTVNEVVNGVAPADWRPRLAIVPAGTANDFARGLGLPRSVPGALQVALHGRDCPVDAAQVNDHWFVNVSTGGFGAALTRHARSPLKRLIGPLAYAVSGFRRLREFRPARADFEADGRRFYGGPFAFFAVGNAWRTGGGTRVTPRAERSDGLLDVVVVGAVSRFELLTLLPDLRRGTHLEHPAVHYLRARSLRVQAECRLQVNADGEAVSAQRLEYGLVPHHLRLMTPVRNKQRPGAD